MLLFCPLFFLYIFNKLHIKSERERERVEGILCTTTFSSFARLGRREEEEEEDAPAAREEVGARTLERFFFPISVIYNFG